MRSILSLILMFNFVYCEEIEFYPSKANSLTSKSSYYPRQKFTKHFNEKYLKDNLKLRNYQDGVVLQNVTIDKHPTKRAIDPVFHGYPKTREELWNEHFLKKTKGFDQTSSLISLLHNITSTYLNDCTPVILYDNQVKSKGYLFEKVFKSFPVSYYHGYIEDNDKLKQQKLLESNKECLHFIIFISELKRVVKVIGKQSVSKVIVVARSSQWAVHEFLASPLSRILVNLLIIGKSFQEELDINLESAYILYTHKLYVDGLGASKSVAVNFWSHGKFSRNLNLFQPKMTDGYAGHRFTVAAANQPPFIFRRIKADLDGGNPVVTWDGIEIRLLNVLAERNNFSIEIVEPRDLNLGSGDAVFKEIVMKRADIAAAGIYLTSDRMREMDFSFPHSQDCAVFITLMSTALPRYRAILGPFHWHVWVALTFTYLIAIFPLAFSDKHTLKHLLHNSGEVENMFWYVFGTFTNCFTFVGIHSWSKTTKITTRLLIGWYWVFTIIITSCYTGCIIAFVTLPIFPDSVDTIQQLLAGFYRVGTLDRGGWERWFLNSSDPDTNKLLNRLEFVRDVKTGIRNTTKAFFWPYAFLGSQAELEYIVQANFTETSSKRAVLHISNECFVPFGVGLGFPKNSVYYEKLSIDVRRMFQSGIIDKITNEVRWEIQRNSFGRLSVGKESRRVNSFQEKGLTLEDTQGMFLLLAAGFLIATGALISEWMGGCSRKRTFKHNNRAVSLSNSTENVITDAYADSDEIGRFFYFKIGTGSTDTLEGEVINVSEESISIHNEYNVHHINSNSSSADVDREVREIFETDKQRKTLMSEGNTLQDKGDNASHLLGDYITTN